MAIEKYLLETEVALVDQIHLKEGKVIPALFLPLLDFTAKTTTATLKRIHFSILLQKLLHKISHWNSSTV